MYSLSEEKSWNAMETEQHYQIEYNEIIDREHKNLTSSTNP